MFRTIAARVECDHSLLYIRAWRLGFISEQARIIDEFRSRVLQIFQPRLRKRIAPLREIELSEAFTWVPPTFRRVFLHQTGRERYAFAGRFEQRIELSQRDRALLAGAEIERMIFAHAGVAFALTSLARSAFIELLHAALKRANFFRARELRAGRRRPRAFIPAGKNQVRPFLILRLRHGEALHAR